MLFGHSLQPGSVMWATFGLGPHMHSFDKTGPGASITMVSASMAYKGGRSSEPAYQAQAQGLKSRGGQASALQKTLLFCNHVLTLC